MLTDRDLLQRYARDASNEAFAEIVRRHVDLVYGTALRQLCGHAALAADVTQSVFTALATQRERAAAIDHLAGWLHGTTRFTVSHTVRAERRRQDREQKAHTIHALLQDDSGADELAALPPALFDEVLEQLDATDREVVLRRFFEGQSFADLGSAMNVSEDAARMRVTRALEKIRGHFAQRGIRSSAAVLGAALAGQAVAAPAHLAAGILAGSAATVASTGALTLMTTAQTTTLWLTGAVAAVALGVAGYEHHTASALAQASAQLSAEKSKIESALTASEQQTATLTRRAAAAELRAVELERKLTASLAPPAPPPAPKALSAVEEARRLNREKMARYRPLLEAGRPITGAVVVFIGGQAVSKPVEFAIGRETRIDCDDGTYFVTPTLNDDGSVQYRTALHQKDLTTGTDKIVSLPRVTQTPWDPFTVSVGGGRVFAFDPDKIDL